jgi:hypothetical protein
MLLLLKRFAVALAATIGIVTLLAAFTLAGLYLWRLGTFDAGLRALAREQEPAPPATVRLYGPTTVVRGEHAYFHIETSGKVGRATWKLVPATTGAMHVLPDGKAVEFRSLEGGTFQVIVSVAGDGRQAAADHIEFENVDLVQQSDSVSPIQSAAAVMPSHEVPMVHEPPPTITDLALGALDQVDSQDRAAEARVVAGCLRSVIGRIETGLMAPDADPVREVELQARAALGSRYESWSMFMQSVAAIVDQLREQGHVTTAASMVPALSEISGALLTAR